MNKATAAYLRNGFLLPFFSFSSKERERERKKISVRPWSNSSSCSSSSSSSSFNSLFFQPGSLSLSLSLSLISLCASLLLYSSYDSLFLSLPFVISLSKACQSFIFSFVLVAFQFPLFLFDSGFRFNFDFPPFFSQISLKCYLKKKRIKLGESQLLLFPTLMFSRVVLAHFLVIAVWCIALILNWQMQLP